MALTANGNLPALKPQMSGESLWAMRLSSSSLSVNTTEHQTETDADSDRGQFEDKGYSGEFTAALTRILTAWTGRHGKQEQERCEAAEEKDSGIGVKTVCRTRIILHLNL